MPVAFNVTAPVTYSTALEFAFRPVKQVFITITNGSAMATFAPYADKNTPYNSQGYEGVERPMILTGAYVWTEADFSGMLIAGVKIRSLNAVQLAVVSFNA